jgi:hypothetical protein
MKEETPPEKFKRIRQEAKGIKVYSTNQKEINGKNRPVHRSV